jgi:hypothetical protein
LRAREVAYRCRLGRPWWSGPFPSDAPPLLSADLTAAARARLRQRAEVRRRRIRGRGFRDRADTFWLEAELRLVLPGAGAQTLRRWRRELTWAVAHAADRLEGLRAVQAFVLGQEPAVDRWLRQQLGTLQTGEPA